MSGRPGSFTRRQAAVISAGAVIGGGAAATALAGAQRLAIALLAVLALLLLAGVVQLRRRVTQEMGALRSDIARLTERVTLAQRQLLAAVEDDRLANAERQDEIQQALVLIRQGHPAAAGSVPALVRPQRPISRGQDG